MSITYSIRTSTGAEINQDRRAILIVVEDEDGIETVAKFDPHQSDQAFAHVEHRVQQWGGSYEWRNPTEQESAPDEYGGETVAVAEVTY